MSSQAEEVVYRDSGDQWEEVYFKISTARFSEEYVRGRVLSVVQSIDNKKLVKIGIGTDAIDLFHLRAGKGMYDYSYRNWENAYSQRVQGYRSLAMAIDISGNTVARIHNAGGKSKDLVLRGTNPLVISADGGFVNIRHISITKVPYGGKHLMFIGLFGRTDETLSQVQASRYVKSLANKMPSEAQVTLSLRKDSWFLEQEDYPYFDMFAIDRERPPTLAEYLDAAEIVCYLPETSTGCRRREYEWRLRR